VVVAMFGQAAGVASFPILARQAAEQKWPEMKAGLQDALQHVILAIVPVSILMAVLSRPIVFLLFSRTRMGPEDIEQTALAMMVFLFGAAAWGMQAILGRGFYAMGDTLTPTVIGSVITLLWLPLYWFSARQFQHLGLALASTLGIFAYSGALLAVLFRRLQIPVAGLGSFCLRTFGASAVPAIAALALQGWLETQISWRSLSGSMLHASLITVLFLAAFIGMAPRLGIASWRELRATWTGKD